MTSKKFSCAGHIRGRVEAPKLRRTSRCSRTSSWFGGRPFRWASTTWVRDHYWFEVYNERTGEILIRSDAFGFDDAMTSCAEAVGIARGALFWDLRRKDLL